MVRVGPSSRRLHAVYDDIATIPGADIPRHVRNRHLYDVRASSRLMSPGPRAGRADAECEGSARGVSELVELALPIQERHFSFVQATSADLANAESPDDPA